MVFPRLWLQIETLSFLVTFRELCGGNLGILLKIHEEVRLKIEKKNAKYVEQANR